MRWEKGGDTSRVHVSPELIEVSGSGAPTSKWQQPFDAALTNVFQVQSDIALAIRGIDGQIAHGDTFHNDRHPDLRADFILANPPFNVSDWGGERLREDKRWKYGVPPAGNGNGAGSSALASG